MAKINPNIDGVDVFDMDPLTGLVIRGTVITTPPTTAGCFVPGAILQDIENGDVYRNDGTTAVPDWVNIGDGATGAEGPTGPTGPTGAEGPTGPTGPTGA